MEHHVAWLNHITSLVLKNWQMHHVLKPIAVRLVFVIPIFEDFDDWTIEDKGSIVTMGLNALTVLAFFKLRLQVFIDPRLFIEESFLVIEHVVNVLHISIVVVVTVDFMLAFHLDISVAKNLGLKPFVIIR